MEFLELVGVIKLFSSYFQYCSKSSLNGLEETNTPTTDATVSCFPKEDLFLTGITTTAGRAASRFALFYFCNVSLQFQNNSCTFAFGIQKESEIMAKEQSATRERQRTDLREPRRYKVTIYNDDFTTMDFVVRILTQVFFKSEAEAQALMLQVHHSDKAVVGIYSYDVATSKVRKATSMAREAGFPLRLTVEPEKE